MIRVSTDVQEGVHTRLPQGSDDSLIARKYQPFEDGRTYQACRRFSELDSVDPGCRHRSAVRNDDFGAKIEQSFEFCGFIFEVEHSLFGASQGERKLEWPA